MKYCVSILYIAFVCLLSPARSQSISGVVNSYYHVISVNNASNKAGLTSSAGLSVGMRVLLIQMRGAVVDQTQTAAFGGITAINNAGKYEFAEICGIIVDTVYFKNVLVNSYDASGAIQLVTVPQYTNVTVTGTLSATPWSSATRTGGVLVFEASGSVTLNANIDVSGQGFEGGAKVTYPNANYDCNNTTDFNDFYMAIPPLINQFHTGGTKGMGIADSIAGKNYGQGRLANAGGGGNNHNTGGGGGSNYGAGGKGGNRSNESLFTCHGTHPGLGGMALSGQGYTIANNRIFLGGGGGVGHANNNENLDGGDGGGIVLIKTTQIIGNSFAIRANGTMTPSTFPDPLSSGGDGGSGGGGAGAIILNTASFSGILNVEAMGGRGNNSSSPVNQCLGPGGGGGGGALWVAAGAVPVNVNVNLSGGANGVVSTTSTIGCGNQPNGAAAGVAGSQLFNYVAPEGPLFSCAILPSDNLLRFTARLENESAALNWMVNDPNSIRSFVVQRSTDGIHFTDMLSIPASVQKLYDFNDPMDSELRRFYRIVLQNKNGSKNYSSIAEVTRGLNNQRQVQVFPNPAHEQAVVKILSSKNNRAEIIMMDATGKLVRHLNVILLRGENHFTLPIGSLSGGVYYVRTKGLSNDLTVRIIVK